jgi:hypothetical protein
MIIKLRNKNKVNMIFEMKFKIKIKFHISNEYHEYHEYHEFDNLKETFKTNIIFMAEYISLTFFDCYLF